MLLYRHGVPGGADGGPGAGADGARRRARGHHHLLVNAPPKLTLHGNTYLTRSVSVELLVRTSAPLRALMKSICDSLVTDSALF